MADNIPNSSPALSSSMEPRPGTAQCNITKKWFPEDEVVTFQGQLVSAEGKQILLDRLRTGVDAPKALARPGVWQRFGCIIVDSIIFFIFRLVLYAAFALPLLVPLNSPGRSYRTFAPDFISLLAAIVYFGVLHGRLGKSLGKMMGDLRVVGIDGSAISTARAFARAVAYEFGIVMFIFTAIIGMILGWHSVTVLSLGLLLSAIWRLTDILYALADTRTQRSLHDRICGTRVIKEDL